MNVASVISLHVKSATLWQQHFNYAILYMQSF